MTFSEFENEQMRLTILQILESDQDYSMNDTVIHRALDSIGYSVSHDKLKTELTWLQEQGAVSLDNRPSFIIVKLSSRGQDVALGRASIPGIPRPQPRG
jgi:hypothetical protein